MRTLDTFQEFKYNYYDCCDKLRTEYYRMYGVIKADGHALASDSWSLDAGVLLENGSKVIAGGFFNLSKSPTSILIHLIFVEETYRKNGIYTKIHSLIDVVGTEQNRHKIYSYVHSKNKIMQEHIIKKIGYEPVMQLVSRKIKGN